jgi:hypothetical protein
MPLLALMLACAALGADERQSSEAQPVRDPPVPIERIHKALQRPVALQLPPERPADFRATVTEEFTRPETVLEAVRRDLGGDVTAKRVPPGTIAPPVISVDLLQIATLVKRQVSGALRARAERHARAGVEAALAEFCAAHDCSVLEHELKESYAEGVLTH